MSFQRFRDTVVAQTAAVLMNRGSSRAVHALDNTPEEENYRDAIFKILDSSGGSPQATIDELIGALQVRRDRLGNRGPPRTAARETPSTDRRIAASQLPQLWRISRCHQVPSS